MTKENYHDKGYKELLSKKRNFVKFLKNIVKAKWVPLIDAKALRLCDKEFVDILFDELRSDLIYYARIAGRSVYFYILTELQSTVDFTIPFRVYKYKSAILIREFENTPKAIRERADYRLPVVVPIVFYNGDDGWSVTRNFKDYLQDADLFEGVIDFQYTLVDIKMFDREYLLNNRDAMSAAMAVDKERGGDFSGLRDTLADIISEKQGFHPEEFADFVTWLKHTLKHRVKSKEESNHIVKMVEKGDVAGMTTGFDIICDNIEARSEARGEAKGRSEGLGVSAGIIRALKENVPISQIAEQYGVEQPQVEAIRDAVFATV